MEDDSYDSYIKEYDSVAPKLIEHTKNNMDVPWMEWPTVRDMAKKFKCTQTMIIDIVESSDNLDLIVGMKTYDGFGEFDRKGDYRIEWYE